MKRTSTLFLLFGLSTLAASQVNVDSLFAVWKDEGQPDTVRAKSYLKYIVESMLHVNPDSAFHMAEAVMGLREVEHHPRTISRKVNLQGIALSMQGDFVRSVSYLEQGREIDESIGDRKGLMSSLANLGASYSGQGLDVKALDYFQQSLKLGEELNERSIVGMSLNNIGVIYNRRNDFVKAMEYYQRSIENYSDMGDRRYVALGLNNIGIIYRRMEDPEQALDHFQRALAIGEEIDDKPVLATSLTSIGVLYAQLGNNTKALDFLKRSLVFSTALNDKRRMSVSLREMGNTERALGDHVSSLVHCDQAFALAKEMGALDAQKAACQCLYETYKAKGNGVEALQYLEELRVIEDSINSEETTKKLEQMEFARQIFADSLARAEEVRRVEEGHKEEIRQKNRTRNYLAVSGMFLLLLAGGYYSRARYMRRSRDTISQERDRSENLLLNILPAEIAAELKAKGRAEAREFELVSILFTDFKGFTQASELMSAAELVREINTCFEAFDGFVGKYGVEKIKTIGDAYMAAGGLPVPDTNAARNTVLAALEMQAFMKARKVEREAQGLPAFEMRVGIHTGPVVAGIVGVKKFQYDIWGDTVNTASRMESSGEVGQVNISEATYRLVVGLPAGQAGSQLSVVSHTALRTPGMGSLTTDNQQLTTTPAFTFTPRGKIQAKGKGEMEMYFVDRCVDGIHMELRTCQ